MPNPLKTDPELRQAVRGLHQTLQRPTSGRRNWLALILGGRVYQNLVELQDDKAHRFLPDRIYRLNIADPSHDDR